MSVKNIPLSAPPVIPLPQQEEQLEDTWDDGGGGGTVGPPKSSQDELEEVAEVYGLPITSEATLQSHTKIVTSLTIDHSGVRLLSGSHDYSVRMFDFGGMKSDLKAFKTITPEEGHPIVALCWSPNSDAFLCVTGSPTPKVFDRDGQELAQCPRGDMYIRDMKNTKGHITGCTSGHWHPTDKSSLLTTSEDGTLRIWDVGDATLKQCSVLKPTLSKPGRVSVTTGKYSTDGRVVAAGLMNGSIQLWDCRGRGANKVVVATSSARQVVRGVHLEGTEISDLAFSIDGFTLASRGTDSTLKVWDLRKFKVPLVEIADLPARYANTKCCFSPRDDVILTSISDSKESDGGLVFIDKKELKIVKKLGMPGSAVAVEWHSKVNQIFVGTGDRKTGAVRVLYDSEMSERGVLLAAGRRPRAANPFDFSSSSSSLPIYNPNALPLYRTDVPGFGKKRKGDQGGERTSKSFRPEVGQAAVGGKGAKGQLGATGGSLLTQYIMKQQGGLKPPTEDDVRASILRHAGKEDEFSRFTQAYEKTQPTKIFQQEVEDDEQKEDEQA